MKLTDLKRYFEFIKDEVDGVLLFGSAAKGELTTRSDIDISLVRPSTRNVLFRVFERVGGKYDTKRFEDLPLHIKMDVINNHQVIIGDEVELSYYFYRYRKEWKDMEHRVLSNQFKNVSEMINQRRMWLKNHEISQDRHKKIS